MPTVDLPKSKEHAQKRAGKITGSRAKTVMNGTLRGWAGLSARLYKEEKNPEGFLEEVSAPALEHGNTNEALALASMELRYLADFDRPDFLQHPTYDFIGYSPDSIWTPENTLIEVKCPFNEIIHLRSEDAMPEEHYPQVQMGLWVGDLKECMFASFDPRQEEDKRLFIHIIKRDEDYIERLRVRCIEFWDYHTTQQEPTIDLQRLDQLQF